MAGLITVRLSRNDSQPWGFRLQGGKDFGAPLLVQKVNGGSLAEKAGLQVADAIIKVNGQEVFNLRHKEAQDVIVKAGNSFEVVISRSPGGTWKPAVTPVGNVPAPSPVGGAPAAVTQTSLAYKGPVSPAIGSGHNLSARPFNASPQLNGVGDQGSVKAITSKQYNNPVGLYSEQAIAETLSAQTEVLTTGALGVNFMKNEKTYNSNNSEVLKMVQEIDNEPREPEPVVDHSAPAPAGGVSVLPPPPAVSGLRHVSAPIAPATPTPQSPALQPGQNICADCERLIVGVFVRIKDKNLHVECFKCATCGTSLKNVGYYNINNKLYCDVHAKLVARSNPPAPNLEPVTIPPGARIPSGSFPAPPVSATAHSPQPGTMAPLPFHPPTSSVSAPKPFGGPAPPAPAAPAPFSPATFSPAPPPPAPVPVKAPAPPTVPSSFPKNLPAGRSVTSVVCDKLKNREEYPVCHKCLRQITRGPFITALGKIWCPEHFVCVNANCRRPLQDIGFVEDVQGLYCEFCFEQYLAPACSKCNAKIKGDCLNAIGKHFHPECFTCAYCGKLFGNSPFFLEDALPYCEADWNELFTTKCFSCGFPIEAGDRWVEALNNNYHSQCFNCTSCKKNLEGQSFFAKGGRPFCKNHAR